MISTLDNDIRVPLIALHELLFQIHDCLTVTQYLGALSGRGDRTGALDYLPHKKEENDAIHRAPSLLGGEVVC